MRKKKKKIELRIMLPEPERTKMENIIQKLKIPEGIKFLGVSPISKWFPDHNFDIWWNHRRKKILIEAPCEFSFPRICEIVLLGIEINYFVNKVGFRRIRIEFPGQFEIKFGGRLISSSYRDFAIYILAPSKAPEGKKLLKIWRKRIPRIEKRVKKAFEILKNSFSDLKEIYQQFRIFYRLLGLKVGVDLEILFNPYSVKKDILRPRKAVELHDRTLYVFIECKNFSASAFTKALKNIKETDLSARNILSL